MVYDQFGGAGHALVWKNESGNPEERALVGQFRPRTCPEGVRMMALACGVSVPDLRDNWKVLVGIARRMAAENSQRRRGRCRCNRRRSSLQNLEWRSLCLRPRADGITDIGNCELSYQVIEEAARISREGCWSSTGGRVSDSVRRRVNFLPRSSPLTL
jgi:hypothetical protein